jgi:hypothetical protein
VTSGRPSNDAPRGHQDVAWNSLISFARALLEDETLLGWVGGLPEYEAAARGTLTVTLGTDDDTGITSLADIDLYAEIPRHLAELRDLGRNHPFLFYRKLGFVVTGVMPDANGPGRPDIYMSKPLRRG